MAGKNTAAFGIYTTRAGVENAVDTLKDEVFGIPTFPSYFPITWGRRTLHTRKILRLRRGPLPERVRGR